MKVPTFILLLLLLPLLFSTAPSCTARPLPSSPKQKLFGHSVKNGPLPAHTEVTTFEHNCTTAPCTITQIHVPSIYPPRHDEEEEGENADWKWTTGVVSFYIDEDAEEDPRTATPTFAMTLLELGGVGSFITPNNPQDGSPYSLALMGKTASSGGVFSTMRVPFQRRIRTTIKADPTVTGQSVYWMIIRGVEAYPVVLGDLTLPPTARLTVYRTGPTPIDELELRTLANVSKGNAGALMRVHFDASGPSYTYLEACMRFYPDGSQNPVFLSSGAEDYFLSASYFDEGMFKGPNSGLTYFDHKGSLNVYKTHDRDPILWNDGMQLVFRCGESTQGCGDTGHCPSQFCSSDGSSAFEYDYDIEEHQRNLARREAELASKLQINVEPVYEEYFLANQGQTCTNYCETQSLKCDPSMNMGTDNGLAMIEHLAKQQENISDCASGWLGNKWWAPDQPNYVSGNQDKNFNRCLGFTDTPATLPCDHMYDTAQRVCHCVNSTAPPSPAPPPTTSVTYTTVVWAYEWPTPSTFKHNVPS